MRVEPVEAILVFGEKHVEVRVENSFSDKLEVLIFDSSLVSAFLTDEGYFQGTFQILFNFA